MRLDIVSIHGYFLPILIRNKENTGGLIKLSLRTERVTSRMNWIGNTFLSIFWKLKKHSSLLDLYLQISWNPLISLAVLSNFFAASLVLKRPSLICSFHFTKRCVLISILFIICCSLSLHVCILYNLYCG